MADAEVKTAEMVPKWVPIAEAPLNAPGLVWVADGGERQPNGKRAGRLAFGYVGPYGDGRKARASGFHGDWNITHWMPEPLPPLRGTDMSDGAENVQISPELLERIAAAIDSAREAVPKPRSYEMAHYCMGLEKAAAIARAALIADKATSPVVVESETVFSTTCRAGGMAAR